MHFSTFILKNLFRRSTRSMLTALGVAIAVATTVSLLGIADRFKSSLSDTLAARDIDIMVLEADTPAQLSSDVDEAAVEKIRAIPGVKHVDGALVEIAVFNHVQSGETLNTMVQGWKPGSFPFQALKFVSGRTLQPADDSADANRVIVLGEELARKLGKTVGDTLEVAEEPFEIVGIYHSFTFYENNGAIAPLKQAQKVFFRQGKITGCSVVMDRENPAKGGVEGLAEQINALTDASGERMRLDARPTAEYIKNSEHVRVSQSMARITSVVAAVVGVVSLLNTMIMAVMERVKEISILRAIGWPKSRVVRMILGESLVLSALGAVLGIAIAYVAMRLIISLDSLNGFMDGKIAPWVLGMGMLLALVVGLLGGLYPAFFATRLMPSEGLRHE